MEIEDLPDDVLLHIFSFVEDGLFLLEVVPLVCRRWHALSQVADAWRGVALAEEDLCRIAEPGESKPLAQMVLRAPYLAFAHRYAFPEGSTTSRALRHSSVVVREFDFYSPGQKHEFLDDRTAVLDTLYRSRNHCVRVSFFFTCEDSQRATDSEGRSALEVLASLEKLEDLDLYDTRPFPYAGELSAGLPRLRRICFWQPYLPDALMADLVRGAGASLRSVTFLGIDRLLPLSMESLSHCTELREMRIRESYLTPVCGCSLPSLETLSVVFDANGRTDADALEYATLVASILQRCAGLPDSLRRLRVTAMGCTGNGSLFRQKCERPASAFRRRRPLVRVDVVD